MLQSQQTSTGPGTAHPDDWAQSVTCLRLARKRATAVPEPGWERTRDGQMTTRSAPAADDSFGPHPPLVDLVRSDAWRPAIQSDHTIVIVAPCGAFGKSSLCQAGLAIRFGPRLLAASQETLVGVSPNLC